MAKKTLRHRFNELVQGFDTAMLVSHAKDGELRARPMSIASIGTGGDFWFTTGVNSEKADEMLSDRRVVVVLQDATRFVSITGEAELVLNRTKAEELWSNAWRPWFPEGPHDPELILLHVWPSEAEFWDVHGMRGARYVFDAVRHVVNGERMRDGPSRSHGKVALRGPPPSRHRPALADWLTSALDLAVRRSSSDHP